MSFEGPIEDRLALRELLDSYSGAVLRQDPDAWAALWAKDAVWNLAGGDIFGRDAIVGAWRQAMADFTTTAFVQCPDGIVVEGDTAVGACQTVERLIAVDGRIRDIRGAYEDRYVREGGRWRFAARNYRIVHELPL